VGTKKTNVIIGNSAAAIQAVQSIRKKDPDCSVIIISSEESTAYSPVLTTYYIAKKISKAGMYIVDKKFYADHNVRMVLGKRAVGIDTNRQEVILEDDTKVNYDNLLIATGASPRTMDNVSTDALPFVVTLRTMSDADRIIELAQNAKKIVSLGAGLVSLQTVNSIYKPGMEIDFVIGSHQILSQNIDVRAAEILQKKIQSNEGISFKFGCSVNQVEKNGDQALITLDSGEQLAADMVIVGKGITPNSQMAVGSGIQLKEGILVDDYLRSNVQNVYAAGDVCVGKNCITGEIGPAPNWINACEQGRIAGFNMCGCEMTFQGAIYENVTTNFGMTVASVGTVKNFDDSMRELIHFEPRRCEYRKFVIDRNQKLVGAILVNAVSDIGVIKNFIVNSINITDIYDQLPARRVDIANLQLQ
jgi:nitrite reductase (NADH) large subunit